MSCNSLTNFEYEEAFAKPELLKSNWHLEIKANWPRLSVILFLRLETLQLMLLKLFEQKKNSEKL